MTLKLTGEDNDALAWTKSSHSSNEGPDCVEVAATPGTVHVRDSKNVAGPRLSVPPGVWADFIASVVR
ncbi:DUF397 domain-containing protein [Streptomyces albus]|uniref:DUF397 domain-containing protein n=1 Tax=Streptomyces albus TaxID=1888 RepID=UPI0005631696|nr:DUF397 domain-containing protein [Streptomyces albus]MDI6412357.1 DUF397 domain-containing protein [Streptomyces albus]GHJ19555.1 hypothetical protein TPA0909_11690 [Streptomyces albus]GHJ23711.1 hypothetical protein TPA0909_53250 [Streptomyces albus]